MGGRNSTNKGSSKKEDYSKLQLNLRLASTRLKLLQKKKIEIAMKARVEVATYLKDDKIANARIRIESIIREDFTAEAYEILEMYCRQILARFSVVLEIRELDPSISVAVASLVWASSRIAHEVSEMKQIFKGFERRYGTEFVDKAIENDFNSLLPERVCKVLMQRLNVTVPPKSLVEKYLVEIAKYYEVDFTPDPKFLPENDESNSPAAPFFQPEDQRLIFSSDFRYFSPTVPPYQQQFYTQYPSNPAFGVPVYPSNEQQAFYDNQNQGVQSMSQPMMPDCDSELQQRMDLHRKNNLPRYT